jgi:general secretion pathway protein J
MMRPARPRGFTLVEVLVALFVMAILATLAWQGLDGMLRAREATQRSLDGTTRFATVLAQWERDLGAVYDSVTVPGEPGFDGKTLRLARTVEGGVQMIAWSLDAGVLRRWAGPVTTRASVLQESWLRSQQLLGNEPEQVKLLDGVQAWQVFCWRTSDRRWTNCQSTGDLIVPAPAPPAGGASSPGGTPPPAGVAAPPPPQRAALPQGMQLILRLQDGRTLTREVAVSPG